MPMTYLTRSSLKIPTCVHKIKVSVFAKRDLREIRTYSKATFGRETAFRYMTGLHGAFDLLKRTPFIGTIQSELRGAIRKLTYRSHAIFYQVHDDVVEIMRILHHAQHVQGEIGTA